MRVLLLTQDLDLCGAQRQLVELALGLDRQRYAVRVGTLEPGGPFADDLSAAGIPTVRFARSWRWDVSPILRLAAYLRRERIDVVHAFHFLPNFFSRFAGRLAGTPAIVSSVRGTGIAGWHRYGLDVATCGLCHRLIANSGAGRDHYVGRGGAAEKIVVIKNGMGQRRFARAHHAQPWRRQWNLSRFQRIIGMVAAMEARKDHPLVLRAMPATIRCQPRTGLLLVGDGSRRPALEDFVRAAGLQEQVVFTGQVREPEQIYPLCDVYVQASYREEGISNSILEAMSCALPVVATDVGGNREVVADGVTGYVVPAAAPLALAEALLALLHNPQLAQQMGQAGLARVRTAFSLEAMIEATQHLYDALLDAHVAAQKGGALGISREAPR